MSRSNYNNRRKKFNKFNNNSSNNNKTKKSIEDCVFYPGSNKQAGDFDTNYEFIVNHIKKTCTCGNDIAETLRKLKRMEDNDKAWSPELKTSQKTDDEEK